MKQRSAFLEDFELARLLTNTRDAIRKARQQELNQLNVHIRRASLLRAIASLGENATPVTIAQWLLRNGIPSRNFSGRLKLKALQSKSEILNGRTG